MVIALGALLGKMLEVSDGARQLADWLIGLCGRRGLAATIVIVGLLVGLPVFFPVGVVLLMPIVVALARETERPLTRLGLPLVAGLSVSHGLVPPHPGPMNAIALLHADVGKTILYALAIGLPTALISGLLFSLIGLKSDSPVDDLAIDPQPPMDKAIAGKANPQVMSTPLVREPHFAVVLLAVLLPILLMLARTAAELTLPKENAWRHWATFAGDPAVALAVAVLFSFFALGLRIGISRSQILSGWNECLAPVATILLVVAAGGGFNQVLISSGVGEAIRQSDIGRTVSPLLLGWLAAAAVRVATGSATVAIATAAGLVAPLAGHASRELLVLAMGAGSLTLSHVNDGGFWIVKEYLRMSVPQTLLTWTLLETLISLLALGGVLLLAPWVR